MTSRSRSPRAAAPHQPLVPTCTDPRADYAGFVDLQAACHAIGLRIDAARTGRPDAPRVELLAEEATRLRALPVAGGGRRRPTAPGAPRSRFAAAAVGAADDR